MTDSKQFELVFEGPSDDRPETLTRLKGVLIGDCELSIAEVQNALENAPLTIMRSVSERELKIHYTNIKAAGGKVLLLRPAAEEPAPTVKTTPVSFESLEDSETDESDHNRPSTKFASEAVELEPLEISLEGAPSEQPVEVAAIAEERAEEKQVQNATAPQPSELSFELDLESSPVQRTALENPSTVEKKTAAPAPAGGLAFVLELDDHVEPPLEEKPAEKPKAGLDVAAGSTTPGTFTLSLDDEQELEVPQEEEQPKPGRPNETPNELLFELDAASEDSPFVNAPKEPPSKNPAAFSLSLNEEGPQQKTTLDLSLADVDEEPLVETAYAASEVDQEFDLSLPEDIEDEQSIEAPAPQEEPAEHPVKPASTARAISQKGDVPLGAVKSSKTSPVAADTPIDSILDSGTVYNVEVPPDDHAADSALLDPDQERDVAPRSEALEGGIGAAFTRDSILLIAVLGMALFAGNYYYWEFYQTAHNEGQFAAVEAMLNDKLAEKTAKKVEAKKAEAKKAPGGVPKDDPQSVEPPEAELIATESWINKFQQESFSIHYHAELAGEKLKSLQLTYTGLLPPSLSKEDLANGLELEGWMKKIEVNSMKVKRLDDRSFEARGSGRAYLEHREQRGRTVVEVLVAGKMVHEPTSHIEANFYVKKNSTENPLDAKGTRIRALPDNQFEVLMNIPLLLEPPGEAKETESEAGDLPKEESVVKEELVSITEEPVELP